MKARPHRAGFFIQSSNLAPCRAAWCCVEGVESSSYRCFAAQNEHNHPKPGQVRGQGGRSSYGGGNAGLYRHTGSRGGATPQHEQQQQHQAGHELSSHDLQQEDAVAALTAMKYSPVVPGMLGAAPHDTPTTLLPIPASLRASLEPEDPHTNGWAVPHRLHRSSSSGRGGGAADERDDSELSGWRCCAVCGVRLDGSLPLAAWHLKQHLKAQRAADALNAHVQRMRLRRPLGLSARAEGNPEDGCTTGCVAAARPVAGGGPYLACHLPAAQPSPHPCLVVLPPLPRASRRGV